jgi:hypothetical protein
MTGEKWGFRSGANGLELSPPNDVAPGAEIALWDFATSEIGRSLRMLGMYREAWDALAGDPDAASSGISGNATSQRIEGDDVVLEALYDQWDTVRISREQFEAFLDQLAEFLKSSGQRT